MYQRFLLKLLSGYIFLYNKKYNISHNLKIFVLILQKKPNKIVLKNKKIKL